MSILHHFPLHQFPLLGIKANANLEQLPLVCGVGLGVAFFLYLCLGLLGALTNLELENVNEFIRLQNAVRSSLAAMDFAVDILAQQGEDQIEHRLEIMLEGSIFGSVGDAFKESRQHLPHPFCITRQDSAS